MFWPFPASDGLPQVKCPGRHLKIFFLLTTEAVFLIPGFSASWSNHEKKTPKAFGFDHITMHSAGQRKKKKPDFSGFFRQYRTILVGVLQDHQRII